MTGIDISERRARARGRERRAHRARVELRGTTSSTGLPAGPWDLVVSNPPYVDAGELASSSRRYATGSRRRRSTAEGAVEAVAAARVTCSRRRRARARDRRGPGGGDGARCSTELGFDERRASRPTWRASTGSSRAGGLSDGRPAIVARSGRTSSRAPDGHRLRPRLRRRRTRSPRAASTGSRGGTPSSRRRVVFADRRRPARAACPSFAAPAAACARAAPGPVHARAAEPGASLPLARRSAARRRSAFACRPRRRRPPRSSARSGRSPRRARTSPASPTHAASRRAGRRSSAAVAAAVDGGELPGTPSTVLDLTGAEPVVLREGAVPPRRPRCARLAGSESPVEASGAVASRPWARRPSLDRLRAAGLAEIDPDVAALLGDASSSASATRSS